MNIHRFLPVFVPFFFLAIVLSGAPALSAADIRPPEVKLPAPRSSSIISVEQALKERRSQRTYNNLPVTLSELSQLLWAAQGVSGPGGKRTAPSAGALYPLEVYVVAGNVDGLSAGIYVYKPERHNLLKVCDGDKRTEFGMAAKGQSAVRNAAAFLVISAVYERTTVKYGDRGIRYVHMEAGHAAQNVYLQTVSLKLGTVVMGAFDDEKVKEAAHLTIREEPLYVMPIGKR